MNTSDVLIDMRNLYKYFPLKQSIADAIAKKPKRSVKAVDNISLQIYKNEILSLVGESGCGKSSFARTVIRLYEPDRGSIFYDGHDITHLKDNEMREYRKKMQMVFQDPYSSLNPRMKVQTMLEEILRFHHICKKEEMADYMSHLMEITGLPESALDRYPDEFSGGQRQRIGIARALAVSPEFIIADEPVSALDVSIQVQILNLLLDLQKKNGLSLLFISHNLSVVRYISDRIAVMYMGKIMELGSADEVYDLHMHPYTEVLFKSAPNIDPRVRPGKPVIEGNPPSPIDVLSGCRFCQRCHYAKGLCFEREPELKEVSPGHFCACYRYGTEENSGK